MLSSCEASRQVRHLSQFFEELKRRNVVRVGLAYLAVAWLVLQAADIVLDNIAAPPWLMQGLMFFLVIGLPIALVFAWAYEITPEGIKPEREVDRTTSITAETGRKLNRATTLLLALAVVVLLVDKFVLTDTPAPSTQAEKSVAVLPFIAMSRGPDDEFFADGLTEEILNSLTRLPELLVTARTSAFHFKGKDIPIPEIAQTLGVAHVVEGSVRRDGDRLRVTAQLIRADDGFHVWSENYDRETADTFGVQTDIAEKIATALDVVMDNEQRERMHAAGLRDPEAFIAYQKGMALFARAHGSADQMEMLVEANEWFDRALALAPNLASAYMYHADYYTHFLMENVLNDEVSDAEINAAFGEFESDLENAIRTSAGPETRLAAAIDLATVAGRWRQIPALFAQIVDEPACVATSWMDVTSLAYGKAQDLRTIEQRNIECDPLLFSGWNNAALSELMLGNFDAALSIAERGLAVAPHVRLWQTLFLTYLATRRFEDAEDILDQNASDNDFAGFGRIMLAAASGNAEASTALLREIDENDGFLRRYPITSLAQVGRREQVNALAAELDAARFGYLVLMLHATVCRCGAPWDLDATPNFARLLGDADLPWPPAEPIDWPLKDW